MISETKIDDTFLHSQFLIEGFSTTYRLDRNSNGDGILLYVREDIPSNLTAIENKPTESFVVKLNLRNDKWLINCSYNPYKNLIDNHLDALKSDSHVPENFCQIKIIPSGVQKNTIVWCLKMKINEF